MEKLMTISDVAELLNMRRGQIYQLTFKKRIPYLKKIGGLRFRRSDIEKWLDSNTIQSQPQMQRAATGKKRGRPRGNSLSTERVDRMVEAAKDAVLF
ncbi:MAG: helix-turn-helix domain-containing protein [Nitrospinae bacterium]|nr:helix-turn-helix domain-containing protein [Nitrospinota bacterium]MBI3814317.1 helix-turn-helix domain-containing protein [Nitrospinota bacterium]